MRPRRPDLGVSPAGALPQAARGSSSGSVRETGSPGTSRSCSAKMLDQDPRAVHELVGRLLVGHVDLDQLTAHLDAEAQAVPIGRQPRVEARLAVGLAQAAEAGDERQPRPATRGDVDAVGGGRAAQTFF
jgi:hypothetical protein